MVEEPIDLDVLGQCEMMLKDVVQKNKVAVQGLKQIEVFRQVSARLPKLLKEEAEINSRLQDKSEQEKEIDGIIESRLKAGEEWVDKEKGRLDKDLILYKLYCFCNMYSSDPCYPAICF